LVVAIDRSTCCFCTYLCRLMQGKKFIMMPLLTALLLALSAQGFTIESFPPRSSRFISTQLWAKKAGKSSKRKAAASGGGFGKSTKSKPEIVDDYNIFPALEPQVLGTLVPPPGDLDVMAGELPEEIYQRLDQIYGLPSFNYATDEEMYMSLNEMISSETPKPSSSLDELLKPSSASTGSSDLDLLLATATGATTSLEASSSSSAPDLPLASLAPFSKFRVLHVDPLVLAIDDFFTEEECDRYVSMSTIKSSRKDIMESRSPTVGKDAAAKAQRTSTTWYHHFKGVPELMAKASRLLGLDGIDRWEEPQIVRYRRNEKFTWHLDALGPMENKPNLGGQRIATLLVYLTELTEGEGGATMFRDLGGSNAPLRVRPRKGSALLFFPAAGGIDNAPFDIRTLHCGEAVSDSSSQDKWIAQLWLRERGYTPTAPPGNEHMAAADAISDYCSKAE